MRRTITRAGAVLACMAALLTLPVVSASAASSAPSQAQPRTVLILLDTNNSPTWLPMARQAALAYIDALPSDVQAGLITFGGKWQLVLPPTAARARLVAAVQAVKVVGGTSNEVLAALGGVTSVHGFGGPGSRLFIVSNAESLKTAGAGSPVPVDVVTVRLDNDDHVAILTALAQASGGQARGLGKAASLAAAAFPPLVKAHKSSGSGVPRLPWSLLEGLGAVFVAVFLLALTLFGALARRERDHNLAGQIEKYGPRHAPVVAEDEAETTGKVGSVAVSAVTRVMGSATQDRLAKRLDLAGIKSKPAEWALLGICLGVVIAAALSLVTSYVLVGVLGGAVIGWLSTRFSLSFRIVRRRATFSDQLPDLLQLVASALQSGFSLPQALDAVVREDVQPASGEFSRALAEARLGFDLEDALDAVATRMDSDDLRWTVMAIRIQQGVGGNLAEVLLTIAGTIRERAFLRRQVHALSAEGRLSAYILVALPIVVAGWLFVSSPNYMRPLYTTTLGELMLAVAAALLLIGALWMHRMIRVEV